MPATLVGLLKLFRRRSRLGRDLSHGPFPFVFVAPGERCDGHDGSRRDWVEENIVPLRAATARLTISAAMGRSPLAPLLLAGQVVARVIARAARP